MSSQAGWNAEKDRSIRAVRDSLTTVRVTNTPPFIRAQPRSAERPTPPAPPRPVAQRLGRLITACAGIASPRSIASSWRRVPPRWSGRLRPRRLSTTR
jgi:hypothetical protein